MERSSTRTRGRTPGDRGLPPSMTAARRFIAGSSAPTPTPVSTKSTVMSLGGAAIIPRSSSKATAGIRRRTTGRAARSFRPPLPIATCWSKRFCAPRYWRDSACPGAIALPSICPTSPSSCITRKPPSAWGSFIRRSSAAFPPKPCPIASTMPAPGWWSPPTAVIATPKRSPTRKPTRIRRSTTSCRCLPLSQPWTRCSTDSVWVRWPSACPRPYATR